MYKNITEYINALCYIFIQVYNLLTHLCISFDCLIQVEYEKSLKTYHNSPAYLAYIAAKNRGKSGRCNEYNFKTQ